MLKYIILQETEGISSPYGLTFASNTHIRTAILQIVNEEKSFQMTWLREHSKH